MTSAADDEVRAHKAAAARARMAELATKFVGRSNGDLATIRAALTRLRAGDTGGLDEIQHLAHRMVGTGATFGFETLADRARDLERLAEHQPPGAPPDATGIDRLEAAVQTVDEELAALAARTVV